MILLNNEEVRIGHFPDGTLHMKQNCASWEPEDVICWRYESSEELLALYFLVNHLREHGHDIISLVMPYLPNARMDRAEREEDVFTLKYFINFINSLDFYTVRVLDPHSAASLMIDRLSLIDYVPEIKKLIKTLGFHENADTLFFPDDGAVKRYAGKLGFPYTYGMKTRDWQTGQILSYHTNRPVNEGANILIVDDICSYGRTFLHAARALKKQGAGCIYLYVNHLENSVLKGELIKEDLISRIYTSDSLFTKEHPKITVLWEAR